MSAPGRPSVVLFDLDGTLVDSVELILASYRHTMEVHRGEVPPDSRWLATMGKPVRVQLRDFADSEEELRAMERTYLEHNDRHHDRLIRRYDGVREVLDRLAGGGGGTRLAIVTSKSRKGTDRALESCGFPAEWFSAVVTADDVERPKPDPEPVRRALSATSASEGEALFVGDSVHDMRSGRAAGVRTAAALWGPYDRETLAPARPDHWLRDVGDLRRLLDGTGGE